MSKSLLITILYSLLLSITQSAIADRANALDAHLRGDYAKAAQLWRELADKGDHVAQYNLALLYKQGTGVGQDNNMFQYWLSLAARGNIADAYKRINTKSVFPTDNSIAIQTELSPVDWVLQQNPDNFTLQLASSTNEKLIEQYYLDNQLAGKAGYYRSLREGEYWYALVYGSYPNVNAAKAAVKSLPVTLRKWSPWVRSVRSVHKLVSQ